MIRPVRISHLIVVLLLLLVSAVLERVYDLGIDFLIIFELFVWGYVVYHYPVKYKDKDVNQSHPEIKYVFAFSKIDYVLLFKLSSFFSGMLLALGIGFVIWKIIIVGIIFFLPLIWLGPHRKVKPFKTYRIRSDWKDRENLTLEEKTYIIRNACKLGLKEFSLNENQITFKVSKGKIGVVLLFLLVISIAIFGGYMLINDLSWIWIFVFGLGTSGTFFLGRVIVINAKEKSNLFLVDRKAAQVFYPIDLAGNSLNTDNTIKKEKIKSIIFKSELEYKEKSPFRNNVVNSGRCYSYKVLLRVGSNYLVAFERIHWNKPGFQTKKFAFLFAKSLAGFLNVKLDVSEAIET